MFKPIFIFRTLTPNSRDMANIPVIVVANKMDLVASIASASNTKNNSNGLISGGGHLSACGSSTNNHLDRASSGHLTVNLTQPKVGYNTARLSAWCSYYPLDM